MAFHLEALGRQQKRDQLIAPKRKLLQVLSSTRWHTVLVIQAVYLLFATIAEDKREFPYPNHSYLPRYTRFSGPRNGRLVTIKPAWTPYVRVSSFIVSESFIPHSLL